MISKIITQRLFTRGVLNIKNNNKLLYLFGSASHDEHHHHDYSVHIDKQATWIRYRTNRRLACVQGIQDTHYPMKDPDDSDPFVHLKQNPTFSLQNLAYNDAYYHQDQHQALVNQPHGYAGGSDPIDTRWDISIPNVLTMGAIMTTLIAYLCLQQSPTVQGKLYREKLAIDYVEQNLLKKNDQLNDLKQKIQSLQKK